MIWKVSMSPGSLRGVSRAMSTSSQSNTTGSFGRPFSFAFARSVVGIALVLVVAWLVRKMGGVMTVLTRSLGATCPSTSASARRRFLASLVTREGVGVPGELGRAVGGAPSPSEVAVGLVAARFLFFLARSMARARLGSRAVVAVC